MRVSAVAPSLVRLSCMVRPALAHLCKGGVAEKLLRHLCKAGRIPLPGRLKGGLPQAGLRRCSETPVSLRCPRSVGISVLYVAAPEALGGSSSLRGVSPADERGLSVAWKLCCFRALGRAEIEACAGEGAAMDWQAVFCPCQGKSNAISLHGCEVLPVESAAGPPW